MTTLSCKVTSVDAITDTVYRVRLVPEAAFSFRAGQYLMVVMDERDKRPFSMASTPAEQEFIELHIGASELNLYAMAVMDRILKEREIVVDIPHGDAWLRDDEDRHSASRRARLEGRIKAHQIRSRHCSSARAWP